VRTCPPSSRPAIDTPIARPASGASAASGRSVPRAWSRLRSASSASSACASHALA
jgi:hypothetical protein